MSFVSDIKNPEPKLNLYRMLDDVGGWRLFNEGEYHEKFVHSTGWHFYTGNDIFRVYKDGCDKTTPIFVYLWFWLTKKEKRFVKAWLKMQEVMNG